MLENCDIDIQNILKKTISYHKFGSYSTHSLLRNRNKKTLGVELENEERNEFNEELEKMRPDEDLQAVEEAIPVIVDKVDPEKVEGEMIKEKVVTLIENNPQKAALIMHEWVHTPGRAPSGEAPDPKAKKA